MKKNNSQESPPPKVTKLPSASAEAPLVIDLPDGQKLVVGNIPNGTVIEVATWRGTGRPDSRTIRMMLGVSNAEAIIATEESTENLPINQAPNTKNKIVKLLQYPLTFFFWLINKDPKSSTSKSRQNYSVTQATSVKKRHIRNLLKLLSNIALPFKKKQGEQDQKSREISFDDQISAETSEWLDSILKKSKPSTIISAAEDEAKSGDSRSAKARKGVTTRKVKPVKSASNQKQ